MRKYHQKEMIDLIVVQVIQTIRGSSKTSGKVGPVLMSKTLMRSITDIEVFREDLKNKLALLIPDFNISRSADAEKAQDEAHDFYSWCILFSKK